MQDAGIQTSARDVAFLLFAAGINLVVWVGWWTVSRGTPTWIRYPSIGLLVSVPMLAAGVMLCVRMLWGHGRSASPESSVPHRGPVEAVPARTDDPRKNSPQSRGGLGWLFAGVAALLCAVVVVSTGVSVQRHAVAAQVPDYGETLAQQRDVARQLAALGDEEFATPWGSQLGAILLSGVRFTSLIGPDAAHLPTVLWTPELSVPGQTAFDGLIRTMCKGDVVRVAAQYAVCRIR